MVHLLIFAFDLLWHGGGLRVLHSHSIGFLRGDRLFQVVFDLIVVIEATNGYRHQDF